MKIALCTETLYPMYGVERIVYETAKRLSEHGIDVVVFTSTPKKVVPEINIIQVSNPTIINPPKRNYAFCSTFMINLLVKLLRHNYDIIDARGHLSLIPCSLAARIKNKVSFSAIYDIYANQWNQMYGGGGGLFGNFFENIAFRMPFDKIIVLNSSNKRHLVKKFNISPEKIEILPYAIDVENLDKMSHGVKKRKQILFAGRLVPQKNVSMLLRAFSSLPKDIRNQYELKIVGVGSESDAIRNLSNNLKIKANFLGNIQEYSDLIKEMKRSEIFVMPSIRESLGIAILESMACETAVISTATEGPSDYINNGENGFLVPIGDEESLKECLLEVILNDKLRKKIAIEGRKTAKKYDWNRGIKKLISLYEDSMRYR